MRNMGCTREKLNSDPPLKLAIISADVPRGN
jgi:hypothetical protein